MTLFSEIPCINNVCKGYNANRNLMLLTTTILTSLLRHPPGVATSSVNAFKSDIELLKLSQGDVLHWFQQELTKGWSLKVLIIYNRIACVQFRKGLRISRT